MWAWGAAGWAGRSPVSRAPRTHSPQAPASELQVCVTSVSPVPPHCQPASVESCALTPGCPKPRSITDPSPLCWFGQRYHKIPLHALPYVRADLHQGREDQGQHGHGEAQHVEKGDGSKGLLCIQDVVLIHQYIDSKAGQGDLGQIAGKAGCVQPRPSRSCKTSTVPSCWGPVPLLLPFSFGPHLTTLMGPPSTTALLPAVRTILHIPSICQPYPSSLQKHSS